MENTEPKQKKTGYRLSLVEDPAVFLNRIYQGQPVDIPSFIDRVQRALRDNRQTYRLGAAQLGEALELSRSEYKRAENGKLPLDLNQAVFLACLFNAYFEKHPGFRRELILPSDRQSVLELEAEELAAIANYNMLLAECDMAENDGGASLVWSLLGSARRNREQAAQAGLVSLDDYTAAMKTAYAGNPSQLQAAVKKQLDAAVQLGALQRQTLEEQSRLARTLGSVLKKEGGMPAAFETGEEKEEFFRRIDSAILENESHGS